MARALALTIAAFACAMLAVQQEGVTQSVDGALVTGALAALTIGLVWYAYGYGALWLYTRTPSDATHALLRLAPRSIRRAAAVGLSLSVMAGAAHAHESTASHHVASHGSDLPIAVVDTDTGKATNAPSTRDSDSTSPTPPSLRATLIVPPLPDVVPADVVTADGNPIDAPAPSPEAQPLSAQTTHMVRPGDTLWSIASSLNPDASPSQIYDATIEIWSANKHIIGPNADLILPGQELTIPTS